MFGTREIGSYVLQKLLNLSLNALFISCNECVTSLMDDFQTLGTLLSIVCVFFKPPLLKEEIEPKSADRTEPESGLDEPELFGGGGGGGGDIIGGGGGGGGDIGGGGGGGGGGFIGC